MWRLLVLKRKKMKFPCSLKTVSRILIRQTLEYGAKYLRSVYYRKEKKKSLRFDQESYSGPRITFSQARLCQNCTKLSNIPYLYRTEDKTTTSNYKHFIIVIPVVIVATIVEAQQSSRSLSFSDVFNGKNVRFNFLGPRAGGAQRLKDFFVVFFNRTSRILGINKIFLHQSFSPLDK